MLYWVYLFNCYLDDSKILKLDMGEDHDGFLNFDVNYLIIIILDLLE